MWSTPTRWSSRLTGCSPSTAAAGRATWSSSWRVLHRVFRARRTPCGYTGSATPSRGLLRPTAPTEVGSSEWSAAGRGCSGLAVLQRREQVPVRAGDGGDGDSDGAHCLALADLGAATEALGVVLVDHADRPVVPLCLTLRQQAEVRDLRAGEQHGRAVRAGCDACAAADTGRGVERAVRAALVDGDGMCVRCRSGGCADVAPGLDDPVERAAVDDEVFEDGERLGSPRLDVDHVAVVETAHVQLAGAGLCIRAVGDAVDDQPAHSADAFAAVAVEGDGVIAVRG